MNRELFGKSLLAAKDISSGSRITRSMVQVQGPGKGLSPCKMDALVGRVISRTLKKGDYFLEEDLDGDQHANFSHAFKSRWGLIARFSDFKDMLAYGPRVIEFHLAERDFQLGFEEKGSHLQELIVHVPEYMGEKLFDLCSADESIRNASVTLLQRTIDLTKALAPQFNGKPKVIAHPGAMSLNTKLDKELLHGALMRSIREIDHKNMEILLENLPPYPWYFGGQWKGNYFMDADEISSFCTDTGMGICFDLSHAALYCNAKDKDIFSYINVVKPFMRHVHFADAYGLDGEGVQIGEGDIDFQHIMPLFSDYKGTWVPEIWRGHLHEGKGFLVALEKLKAFPL